MDFREFFRRLAQLTPDFVGSVSQFSFFTLAVLFALSAHLIFAIVLNALAAMGVDFASIDASRSVIPALQVILFVAATGLVLFSIVRSGIDLRKTVAGVAALVWAAGMLMITFVSAQCDLYGYCL